MCCIYNRLFVNKLLFEAIDETDLDKLHLAIRSGADLNKTQKYKAKDNCYYAESKFGNNIKLPIGFAFEKYVHYKWVYPRNSYIYTKLFDKMYTIILTLIENGADINMSNDLPSTILWHFDFYSKISNTIFGQLHQERCANALQLLIDNNYKTIGHVSYWTSGFNLETFFLKAYPYEDFLYVLYKIIFLLYLLEIEVYDLCYNKKVLENYMFYQMIMYYCLDQKNVYIGYCCFN